MKSKIAIAVLAAAVVGCAAPKSLRVINVDRALFDKAAVQKQLEKGNGTIKGSALIRQNGGGVVTCAGMEVSLTPAGEYAKQRIQQIYGNQERGSQSLTRIDYRVADTHPDYASLRKTTICDAQGFFHFDNVAAGEFFVVSAISWQAAPNVTTGGVMMQKVKISGSETKEIVLSP